MYDADDIEAINVDQLATATDRLLLRGAVSHRRRHATPPARDIYPRMVSFEPTARGSQPRIPAPRGPIARGSQSRISPRITPPGEPTLQMRAQPSSLRTQVFAVTVVIPTLVGIAVGLAALL